MTQHEPSLSIDDIIDPNNSVDEFMEKMFQLLKECFDAQQRLDNWIEEEKAKNGGKLWWET